jgi:hypothetical protein
MGKFDGTLVTMAMARKNPFKTVVKITIGDEIGSGVRTFNPWVFKAL